MSIFRLPEEFTEILEKVTSHLLAQEMSTTAGPQKYWADLRGALELAIRICNGEADPTLSHKDLFIKTVPDLGLLHGYLINLDVSVSPESRELVVKGADAVKAIRDLTGDIIIVEALGGL